MPEQLPKIAFLDRSTFYDAIAFPVARFAAEWQEHARTTPDEVLTHAAGSTVVVTNKVKLPAVLLGPEQHAIPSTPRQTIRARLHVEGKPVRESEPLRLPERFGELVQLAAETLSRHGEQLAAGDWMICGAIIEPLVVSPGNRIEVEMSPFERMTLDFTGP